jgi:hypothetical protein
MPILTIGLTLVLITLAALHVVWAIRGVGTTNAIPSRPDGTPVFRPGRIATLGVAIALTVAALLVAGRARLADTGLSPVILHVGVWGVAAAFALRTIGEFRYVGLFKRVRGTSFAQWDTRLFTPLCAAIAIAAALVAAA